jgi:hypothetical protein
MVFLPEFVSQRHATGRPTCICDYVLPLLIFIIQTDCTFSGVNAEARGAVVGLNIIEHDQL